MRESWTTVDEDYLDAAASAVVTMRGRRRATLVPPVVHVDAADAQVALGDDEVVA